MYASNPQEQYKIEYTTLLGEVYCSQITTFTRDGARKMVRFIRTHPIMPMVEPGRRARLKSIRVVKS